MTFREKKAHLKSLANVEKQTGKGSKKRQDQSSHSLPLDRQWASKVLRDEMKNK